MAQHTSNQLFECPKWFGNNFCKKLFWTVAGVADPRFKICQNWPKMAIWEASRVPMMSVEGTICIGANVNGEQTPCGNV